MGRPKGVPNKQRKPPVDKREIATMHIKGVIPERKAEIVAVARKRKQSISKLVRWVLNAEVEKAKQNKEI